MAEETKRLKVLREMLVQRRNELGLSQREIATRLNWDQSYIAKVETGVRGLSIEEFVQYSRALELEPTKLLATFMKAAKI